MLNEAKIKNNHIFSESTLVNWIHMLVVAPGLVRILSVCEMTWKIYVGLRPKTAKYLAYIGGAVGLYHGASILMKRRRATKYETKTSEAIPARMR